MATCDNGPAGVPEPAIPQIDYSDVDSLGVAARCLLPLLRQFVQLLRADALNPINSRRVADRVHQVSNERLHCVMFGAAIPAG